jgi:hypothetical protein
VRPLRWTQTHVVYASAWPALVDGATCARAAPHARTAGTTPRVAADDAAVRIVGTTSVPVRDLRWLAARCDTAAALRFLRMPFFDQDPGSGEMVVGDLRYDREAVLGFAELEVSRDPPSACPRFIPPWTPWRDGVIAAPP